MEFTNAEIEDIEQQIANRRIDEERKSIADAIIDGVIDFRDSSTLMEWLRGR
jgi:hypothetical protein